jgi:hypothetical protein
MNSNPELFDPEEEFVLKYCVKSMTRVSAAEAVLELFPR